MTDRVGDRPEKKASQRCILLNDISVRKRGLGRIDSHRERAVLLLLFFANLLLCLTIWMEQTYDQVRVDQILFQLKSSSKGVNGDLSLSAIVFVGGASIGLTVLEAWLLQLVSGTWAPGRFKLPYISGAARHGAILFAKKHILLLASVFLAAALVFFGARTEIISYVKADATDSEFIQTHYVQPKNDIVHFPTQKRNLIYIFLESMESTYADPAAGGMISTCYIPELEALAQEHINFSQNDGLGGALSYPGTTWTAAAMVAQTSGVNIKVSLKADSYGAGDVFLPGAVSIGQFLAEQGYNQVLLLGSDAEFHGRELYFTEHGGYEILDIDALKAQNRLPADYNKWWGFEDEKLFSYAREELTRLAETGQPFNLTMLTADTHFPDGCPCRLCADEYDQPYANVLACSSRQVADFVSWIMEQPFYENTVIVISGDHLTMDAGFMEDIDPEYTRTIYNCFINPAAEPRREKNRQFGTFDMFPTTLAALGAEIDGDRLALGTNLFSDRETLAEQYGCDYLASELQKQSDFYDAELLQLRED